MKRRYRKSLLVISSVTLLMTGCAQQQMTDSERTRTEGTLVGAAGGAALGALIGDRQGALIGAALGGAAGYAYGSHVAEEKAKYARAEDWLDASIARAERINRHARAYNNRLRKKIAESRRLAKLYRQKKVSRSKMLAQKRSIDHERAQASRELQKLQGNLKYQQEVIAEARKGGNSARVRRLSREISRMKSEERTLRENTQTLASLSASAAV